MSTTRPTRHVEQNPPFEWRAVEHAGEQLVIHQPPERLPVCYRVTDSTRNVRALVHADAVIYNGNICEPIYREQYGSIALQHDYAGELASLRLDAWLDEPAVRLAVCPRGDLEQWVARRATFGGGARK